MNRNSSPALLLGAGITVLGTIRSLSRAGIPAFCLSPKPGIERHSRFYRTGGLQRASNVAELRQALAACRFERVVLMPCSDDWLRALSEVQLDTLGPAALSAALHVNSSFVDKWEFARILCANGIPHPVTVLPRDPVAEILLREADATYFLKPRDSQGFFKQYGRKGVKVSAIDQCLGSACEFEEAGHSTVLQEHIPGGADQHYYVEGFVDRFGSIKATFVRQRLRMYPPDFGNSTMMVSVSPTVAAEAVESTHRLLNAVKYRGIYSAEFKLDRRDGRFKLLEVNSRPWWYIEFATRCGVNVAEMAYQDALERPVAEVATYRRGAHSMDLYTDWHAWHEERRRGKTDGPHYIGTALHSYYTLFSWRDPLPATLWVTDMLRQKTAATFKRRAQARKGLLRSSEPALVPGVQP